MNSPNTTEGTSERMLPMGQMCKRYGVTDRTIDRWLEQGLLPVPMRLNRYRYWRESELVQFERKCMAAAHQPETNDAA